MTQSENPIRHRLETMDSDDLRRLLLAERDQWRPEALSLAIQVLQERGEDIQEFQGLQATATHPGGAAQSAGSGAAEEEWIRVYISNKPLNLGERVARVGDQLSATALLRKALFSVSGPHFVVRATSDVGGQKTIARPHFSAMSTVRLSSVTITPLHQLVPYAVRGAVLGVIASGIVLWKTSGDRTIGNGALGALLIGLVGAMSLFLMLLGSFRVVWRRLHIVVIELRNGSSLEILVPFHDAKRILAELQQLMSLREQLEK